MIITPAERRIIILESLRHEQTLKDLAKAERLHAERLHRQDREIEKTREKRKLAMIAHEEVNRANRVARQLEVDARQKFIKSLNVI